ncbi:hypothetical protein AB1E33_15505 [Ruegeria sp. 2012CJ15-1]
MLTSILVFVLCVPINEGGAIVLAGRKSDHPDLGEGWSGVGTCKVSNTIASQKRLEENKT